MKEPTKSIPVTGIRSISKVTVTGFKDDVDRDLSPLSDGEDRFTQDNNLWILALIKI